MKKSWLTASSALAALGFEANPATAQLFTAPSQLDFGDVLVGTSSSSSFPVVIKGQITSGSIPAASAPFSGGPYDLTSSSKGSFSATYSFAPTVIGGTSDVLNASAKNLDTKAQQLSTIKLIGTGVAPVESVATDGPTIARIGTTGLQTVTVTNVGDGNLAFTGKLTGGNLTGTVGGSSGVFQGKGGSVNLKDGAQTGFSYVFTPTSHGVASRSVDATFKDGSADGKNQASKISVMLTGQGVGPVYDSNVAPGGTMDFGNIAQGATGFTDLLISNVTTDVGSQSLTGLTILGAGFTNPDFKFDNFVPGTILDPGGVLDLKIDFTGNALGLDFADLTITTDQDNAFGQAGDTFNYKLDANVLAAPTATPEPGTSGLVAAGIAGIAASRRRPRRG